MTFATAGTLKIFYSNTLNSPIYLIGVNGVYELLLNSLGRVIIIIIRKRSDKAIIVSEESLLGIVKDHGARRLDKRAIALRVSRGGTEKS